MLTEKYLEPLQVAPKACIYVYLVAIAFTQLLEYAYHEHSSRWYDF